MDIHFLPEPDPVHIRASVMDAEAELRELAKDLHPGGHFEARCLVRDAADMLLAAGRALAAETPGRPVARPGTGAASPPLLHLAN